MCALAYSLLDLTLRTLVRPATLHLPTLPTINPEKARTMILHTARDRYRRTTLKVATTIAASVFFAAPSVAETWSDASGKFTIEADYAGVKGADLVLRKPDGTTLNVPINRLSTESRNQAKRLYEAAQKAGSTAPTQVPSNQATSTYQPAAMELTFTPPEPPEIAPMPAFPVGASLQETVDFVRGQAMAGHLEVFWIALPDDFRASIDSSEMREVFRGITEKHAEASQPTLELGVRTLGILVNKKKFVLGTPMLAEIPAEYRQKLELAYNSAVGLIYEHLYMMTVAPEMGLEHSVSDILNYHLPRIGGHLAELLRLAPPEATDHIQNYIVVVQSGPNTGQLKITDPSGETVTKDMVRYQQRWVTSEIAKGLEDSRGTLVELAMESVDSGSRDADETENRFASMVPKIDQMLDPFEAAQSQQEFDAAIYGLLTPFMRLMGGPGGPPTGQEF